MTTSIDRLLLTGAAGTLGRALTAPLRGFCRELTVSDLAPALAARGIVGGTPCDLSDRAAVSALTKGMNAVVHLGGVSVETPFEPILQANIRGLFNLYEAARLNGVKRIVFASSNHVTGCYRQDGPRLDEKVPVRPDGYYGLSKLFGEGIASMYWDRYGVETVCLRIGTATPEPFDRRSLASWLSPGDLVRLVHAALTAPDVGFTIAYGISNNSRAWYDGRAGWARIGYVPQDASDAWADKVGHIVLADAPDGPMATLQGGSFLGIGPFDNE